MKTLLILAGSVVFLALAVVAIGMLLPKRHVVTRSATYQETSEKLFSLIVGPQDWRTDIVRSEAIAANDGRILIRETTKDGESTTYEVLESTPPNSLKRKIATQNLPYSGSWLYSLKRSGGNTVVRITEDGEVYNPIFRFMSRFVFGQTRTMESYLRALGRATGQEVMIEK